MNWITWMPLFGIIVGPQYSEQADITPKEGAVWTPTLVHI
jgi:hypothetical protein